MKYAALLLLLAAGCSTPSSQVREFLGPEIMEILQRAERVEPLRIDGGLGEFDAGVPRVADYAVIAQGEDLSQPHIERLRSLIFDEANWQFDVAKACEFMPGVDFRFHAGDSQLDVLLCFSCDEWAFWHNERMLYEDNDRARGALLRLARDAFPGDPVLESLE